MSDPDKPPTTDRLTALLEEGDDEETVAFLNRLGGADADARKRVLRGIRDAAGERPGRFEGVAPRLVSFLTDGDRAVRLTTAKLFVALAASSPATALPVADALAERLADEGEFYYVRARCAEALGYLAVESPDEVADPATLADLRVGLEFDEPEVKVKLAKALEHLALGDPGRLRHQVDSLADHLDDEGEVVRYHLCTALVVVACEFPERVSDATDALRHRLADEEPYVRGRAAEALGLVAESRPDIGGAVDPPATETDDETPSFLTVRLRYLRRRLDDSPPAEAPVEVGTVESVRDETEAAVDEMTSPGDGECPSCGLELPDGGPPMCPRCGTPR